MKTMRVGMKELSIIPMFLLGACGDFTMNNDVDTDVDAKAEIEAPEEPACLVECGEELPPKASPVAEEQAEEECVVPGGEETTDSKETQQSVVEPELVPNIEKTWVIHQIYLYDETRWHTVESECPVSLVEGEAGHYLVEYQGVCDGFELDHGFDVYLYPSSSGKLWEAWGTDFPDQPSVSSANGNIESESAWITVAGVVPAPNHYQFGFMFGPIDNPF